MEIFPRERDSHSLLVNTINDNIMTVFTNIFHTFFKLHEKSVSFTVILKPKFALVGFSIEPVFDLRNQT